MTPIFRDAGIRASNYRENGIFTVRYLTVIRQRCTNGCLQTSSAILRNVKRHESLGICLYVKVFFFSIQQYADCLKRYHSV